MFVELWPSEGLLEIVLVTSSTAGDASWLKPLTDLDSDFPNTSISSTQSLSSFSELLFADKLAVERCEDAVNKLNTYYIILNQQKSAISKSVFLNQDYL